MRKFKIGLQLHNVRDLLDCDFKKTCQELVKLGLDGVEFATTHYGLNPQELSAYLKSIGLGVSSSMCNKDRVTAMKADIDVAYAKAFGTDCIICSGSGDFTLPEVQEKHLKMIRNGCRIAQANGMCFAYHNHAKEMVVLPGGKTALEVFMDEVSELKSELDVYWVKKGGQDPVGFIKKFGKRIARLHFKDMDAADESFTELGKGTVDLKACLAAAEEYTDCEWIIYEQDKCKGGDPMASAVESIAYLKRITGR